MAANYFMDKIREAEKVLQDNNAGLERVLGKGLMQPFNNTGAGARKLMFGTHITHVLPLLNGEKAIVETGYEIRYGDLSSSITKTDSDYRLVGKISKFSFSPNHHYWLIFEDLHHKRLDVVERISYHHITESYGYLYNNEFLDSLKVNDVVPNNTIVQKSLAFDEYNNRKTGANFNVAYMALDQNMEDSIIMSDKAAEKLVAPLVKPVTIMINENDIPLNIYGTNDVYKCIPDIGEDIKDAVLIALRKEKKEESLFTQSVERLKEPMMSDKKNTLIGKVVDVDIYCNNPNNLDMYYNSQFKMYYNELQRSAKEIVQIVTGYEANGFKLSYELSKLFANAKRILKGDLYADKKQFSNIVLKVTVLEEKEMEVGDKASNRYGGKGVVSEIRPQELMPKFGDEYVDVIFNSYTMPNRENPGQCFECEITHVGCAIVKKIAKGNMSIDDAMGLIYQYLDIVSPSQSKDLRATMEDNSAPDYEKQEMKRFFLTSVIRDGAIQVSIKPISESFDIDRLDILYKTFPWVNQDDVTVCLKDSSGNYRRIKTRRPIIVGKQYIFRLKQYAEEKFSATSLSATNIRNENTKSKAARDHIELYRPTPVRFGGMETNDMNHLGAEVVITNLMIHSLSPNARRLTEQLYTRNPYHVDIRLGENSTNRSAEILNTYLKTIGKRLVFTRVRKNIIKPITFKPLMFFKAPVQQPIFFMREKNYDAIRAYNDMQELQEKIKAKKDVIHPIYFTDSTPKKKESNQ